MDICIMIKNADYGHHYFSCVIKLPLKAEAGGFDFFYHISKYHI